MAFYWPYLFVILVPVLLGVVIVYFDFSFQSSQGWITERLDVMSRVVDAIREQQEDLERNNLEKPELYQPWVAQPDGSERALDWELRGTKPLALWTFDTSPPTFDVALLITMPSRGATPDSDKSPVMLGTVTLSSHL